MTLWSRIKSFFGPRIASAEADLTIDAKEFMMSVSAQFQTALDGLVHAYEAKVAAIQAELDALKAKGDAAQVDIDDTAAVVNATPTTPAVPQ